MGWIFIMNASRKEVINTILERYESQNGIWETVAHCLRGNNLWTVKQFTEKKGGVPFTAKRYISLYMLAKDSYHNHWGYEHIHEETGPNSVSCPLSYLTLACPSFSARMFSTNWRLRVSNHYKGKVNKYV